MTKSELADKLYAKLGGSKKDAATHVEAVLDLIKTELEKGETIKISGFGVFEVKSKAARRGRNPQTGESMILDARKVLSFKPSTLLRTAVNKGT